jgi:hypothetical protein
MQASVSIPVDYTVTQFLSRIILPRDRSEETAEREDQSGSPSVRSIYPSLIGRGSAVGDPIIRIESWRNPIQASATIGALSLALRLGTTFGNTDFFSAQDSAAIAGALDSVHKPAIEAAISQIEEFHPTERTIDAAKILVTSQGVALLLSNADSYSTLGWTIAGPLDLKQEPAIEAAIFQIEEFQSRKDGWKGPNSFGPTERTIDEAKTFAKVVLADTRIDPPHIGLAADGEITFFWQNPNITIDVSLGGDGNYAYFAKPHVGRPFFEDAAPITRNFPEKILSLLRRAA